AAAAAMKVYVAPGDLDEYYMFASGGHSGQVYVYGVPSMRPLPTIPVYTPYPATGYGFDDESKAMLGGLTWGDVHHPSLSETNGDYAGRWRLGSAVAAAASRRSRSAGRCPPSPATTPPPSSPRTASTR